MRMHNPPHPDELVREECLAPLGLNVTAAARALGGRGMQMEYDL
jgi:antitoxin HigA-1